METRKVKITYASRNSVIVLCDNWTITASGALVLTYQGFRLALNSNQWLNIREIGPDVSPPSSPWDHVAVN